MNLNDRSVEGLRHAEKPIEAVQYHPEGAPVRSTRWRSSTGSLPRSARRPHDHVAPDSVLILGSGPVVIGQAAEFDYAGTQACRALRGEGVRTILVNCNPATIMTDPDVADAIYLEPLTVEAVEVVIAKERPDGLPGGARRTDGPQPRHGPRRGGRLRALRRAAARDPARGDPDGRGP